MLHADAAYVIIRPVLRARLPGGGRTASFIRLATISYGLLVAPPISGSLGAFSHAWEQPTLR